MGSQGEDEGVAIFHRLVFDEWTAGSLEKPLTRITVDGVIEWNVVMIQQRPPPQARSSGRLGVEGMPKYRATEQGDVVLWSAA